MNPLIFGDLMKNKVKTCSQLIKLNRNFSFFFLFVIHLSNGLFNGYENERGSAYYFG